MGLVHYLITKLVGYDILNSEKELKVSLDNIQRELSSVTQHRDNLMKEADSRKGEIVSAQKEIEDIKKELASRNKEYDLLSEIFRSKEKEIKDLSSTISSKEKEIEQMAASIANHDDKEKKLVVSTGNHDEIRELEAQIQKKEETIQAKNREIEVLQLAKKEGENRFIDVCFELKSVRVKKNLLKERVQDLEQKNVTLSQECAELKKQLSFVESELAAIKTVVAKQDELEKGKNVEIDEQSKDKQPEDTLRDEETNKTEDLPNTLSTSKRLTKKTAKSKEEEVVDLINDVIVDLPPISNDSNRTVQRSIEFVYDDNGKRINADEFFTRSSAEEIAQIGRKMSESELSGIPYWTCGLCHHRVKIAHRTYNGNESLFFIHANRNHYCPWIKLAKSSIDNIQDDLILTIVDIIKGDNEGENKPKNRELKEKIFAALTSQVSMEMGITDVRIDEIIRSNVPYMKWRRPDISFLHNGRKVVIELQKKSHDIDTIVDLDVFCRLNDIQILWVFGSDSDSSYEYMRKMNYKNTMFDNHRNVFVFDKEAQAACVENEKLYLKCNWLDEDNVWYYRLEKTGTNGKLVNLEDLIYDDEYCKPYYFDANEKYFLKQPEACKAYLATKMTREELMKSIKEKWTRNPKYEEAQALMHQRQAKITPFCVMGLWGVRFNTTMIIPPIFTTEPKDLYNGYFVVCQGEKLGVINYYGDIIVNWDGSVSGNELVYDTENRRLLFSENGMWGVEDITGNVLIPPIYQSIQNWNNSAYRVRKNNKWGVCDIHNDILADCKYEKIDRLINSQAVAVKPHPTKGWLTVSGLIDEDGHEIFTSKFEQKDGWYIIQSFELWGITDENSKFVLDCCYEEILPWSDNLYRVKENGKWGIYNLLEKRFLLRPEYDSIGDLKDGVAKIIFAKVESAINIKGKEVSQKDIQLQNGLKKTMIAGKWGIINDQGDVIIEHRYNEIGSFRSRLIGIINEGEVIKLNQNYEYPINITGKYLKTEGSNHYFIIGGATCVLPEGLVKQVKKALNTILNTNQECTMLAFGNIIKNKYLLRVVEKESLKKKLSHGDLEDSFTDGVELIGTITSFKSLKGRKRKAIVRFPNGKETSVPRRYFVPSSSLDNVTVGQSITLKKTGYDKENDQTIWQILKLS